MKNRILLLLLIAFTSDIFAQGVKISSTPGSPDASAILEAESTTKGLLPPRMTTSERDAISSPAEGLQVFNLSTGCIDYFFSGNWRSLCGICPAPAIPGAGTHVADINSIEWNWNTVSGATGYKYNVVNNYNTATDVGSSITYTQTGLSCNNATTLYVWAYNSCGPSDVITLNASTTNCCGQASTVTDIDGNVYNIVSIGSQCWMKENLKTTQTAAGNPITRVCYNNNSSNCNSYGGMYTWATTMNGASSSNAVPSGVQGICPSGWHIPSDPEWCELESFIGISDPCGTTGGRGAPAGTDLLSVGVGAGTDLYGFSLLLAGDYRPADPSFNNLGSFAFIWSSTIDTGADKWTRQVSGSGSNETLNRQTRSDWGISVRCIKD